MIESAMSTKEIGHKTGDAASDLEGLLESAERHADSGKPEDAWNALQRAVRLAPKDKRVLKALAEHFETRTGMKPDLSGGLDEKTGLPRTAVNGPDGSVMLLVPAGDFLMGTKPESIPALVKKYEPYGANFQWFNPEIPQRKLQLNSFYVGKCAITAAQYSDFLNRANLSEEVLENYIFLTESTTLQFVDGKFRPRAGLEKFPVNNVTAAGADAYCKFMGLRLPREVEWEKAARGTDGREFPWGNEDADETRARFSQRWKENKFNVMVAVDDLPKGVGPYGTYNMAGNVWEWCADEFPHPEPGAKYRVLRGGGWNFNPLLCRCPYRSVNKSDFRNSGYGFRPFRSI